MDPLKNWLDSHNVLVRDPKDDDFSQFISRPIRIADDKTNYSDSNEEIFRNPENHVGALASILSKCAGDAKFFPSQTLDISTNVFESYVNRVTTFPGFSVTSIDRYSMEAGRNDVDAYIDILTELYIGVDVSEIKKAVGGMVNCVINESTALRTGFYQGSIFDDGALKFVMVLTDLNLSKNGKMNMEAQSSILAKVEYSVNPLFITNNATILSENIVVSSYEEWFKESTSKGAEIATKNCVTVTF
jgi:hypothetical protein